MARPHHRPRIAVTCDAETKPNSRGTPVPRFWLGEDYVRALDQAGAEPYLLAPQKHYTLERATAALGPMDALVVTGGAFDIDPVRYGQVPHPLCGPLMPDRTAFEALVLQAANTLGLPVLGICGGMQLMVVQHGGSLHQDVQLRPNTLVHEQPFDKTRASHGVSIQNHSLLQRCYPEGQNTRLEVNSTHHQLVDDVGTLEAVGHSPDGVVEAVERLGGAFYLGVQWHPESLADQSGLPIYRALVAAAAQKLR